MCTMLQTPTRMIGSLISVAPSSALVDSRVSIQVTGVEPNSHLTIRSVLEQNSGKDGSVRFEGHAHYIADDRGVISVPKQTSWGGTYTGVDPMGLFWSMKPSPGQRSGCRYLHKDVTRPMLVNLSLHRGHLDTETLKTAELEASTTAERWFMGKDVERIPVRVGRLRGSLFKPKGTGPFPGVIDMFGSVGRLVEFRAAMLASRGFACYALPYFGYDDLPKHMWDLKLEYFKEAIDWFSDQPYVKPGGVGMIGVSSGAQIIMAVATHIPEKLRAAVLINGLHAQALFPMNLNGESLPFIEYNYESVTVNPSSGSLCTFEAHKDTHGLSDDHPALYRPENAPNCHFLFVVGEDDKTYDSLYNARESMKRLHRTGRQNYKLLSYPAAGHLIEIPYVPGVDEAFSNIANCVIDYGGTVFGNAKAMEDSWPKILRFLNDRCGIINCKL